jgi:hypothetical protein
LLAHALAAGAEARRGGKRAATWMLLGQALARAKAGGNATGLFGAHQLLGQIAYELGNLDTAQKHHEVLLGQSQTLGFLFGEPP